MKKYKYLRLNDRKRLAELYEGGETVAEIARVMDVHPGTVYNELRRGYTGKLDCNLRRQYDPDKAQRSISATLRNRGEHFTGAAKP